MVNQVSFMTFGQLGADAIFSADLMTLSSTTSTVTGIDAYIYLETTNWDNFIG